MGHVIEKLGQHPVDLGIATGSSRSRDVILRESPSAIAALELVQEDYSRLLDRIDVPSLVLWGADDKVTPLRTGLVLEARLPNVRLEHIAGAGHVPMAEQPEIFNRRVLAFLEDRSPQPPTRQSRSIVEVSERKGSCEDESGVVFSGSYDRIEINGCSGVRLVDVTARFLQITSSEVEIINSLIEGEDSGIIVRDSYLEATATSICGRIAVDVGNSALDFAAVNLLGTNAALSVDSDSTLVASVSEIASTVSSGPLHGFWKLQQGVKR